MNNNNQISRRSFIGKCANVSSAALLTGALSAKAASPKTMSTKQKNVLLLVSDDHGIDQLGCYGNGKIKTPHLDSLASDGVRFTNAFCIAASCSASRGTILSGLYTHQNGQFGHQHNWHHFSYHQWVKSIPMLLKENGYQTGVVGKLHVAPDSQLPFDFAVSPDEIMGNRDVTTMADKAGEFFNQNQTKPFFLLVGYSDPHRMPRGKTKITTGKEFSGFGNELDYPGVSLVGYKPEDVHVPEFLPDTPETREELAEQYESISRLDSGIGKILDKLKKSGRYEDTLIIYLSDNGIPFPGAKTNIYDSGVQLPMIVRTPGLKNDGSEKDAMVSFIDLMPTILEWTGTKGPDYELPGKSFLPVLNGADSVGRDAVYMSHTFHEITMYYPMRAVRTRKYKYIHNLFPELEFPFATDLFQCKTWQGILKRKSQKMGKRSVRDYLKRPAEELYDIEADPVESKNLATDPDYQDVLKEMRTKLTAERENTNDPWLIINNYTPNRALYE